MQTIHNRINWLVAATLLAALGGCTRSQCRDCGGCGHGCVGQLPDPRGAHTQAVFDLHAGKAEADDFVVYQHEWTHGRDELGPRGRRHLEQIAKRLPHEPFAVVIETSGDASLDDNRRSHVLSELAGLGVVDPDARVIVGYSEAEGLSAADADRVANGQSGTRSSPSSNTVGGITNSGGQLGGFRGSFGGGFRAF